MPLEIERKFLVTSDQWRAAVTSSVSIRQGYIDGAARLVTRVRIADSDAYLTLKSRDPGLVRHEFEYAIPRDDAEALLNNFCRKPLIEKTRHFVPWQGQTWTIDVFAGAHAGLTLVEIELAAPDQEIDLPPWLGAEVTDDPAYRNEAL